MQSLINSVGCGCIEPGIDSPLDRSFILVLCLCVTHYILTKKAEVIKNLEWGDAFDIFGRSNIPLLRTHYRSTLRRKLSPASQTFWDARLARDFSFMYSGTSGLAAWFLVYVMAPLLGLGFIRRLVKKGVSKVLVSLVLYVCMYMYLLRV